jgi:peroxiredoxin
MYAGRTPSLWMRIAVVAAGAHCLYDAAFSGGSIEIRSLWVAIGVGLFAASADPFRYWPAVLTALVARVAPQIAFTFAGVDHPVSRTLVDAVWWVPLTFILFSAYSLRVDRNRACSAEVLNLALRAKTNKGVSVAKLSCHAPVLLVFLRHGGCTFCREALADIAARRHDIEASGTRIVLVHMGQPESGINQFRKYGLDDLHQISDPCRGLYRAFGLRRGNLWKLFGPKVWLRAFDACILKGHGAGRVAGDPCQMPGMFLLFHGQLLRSYRHQSAADRPDYVRFITEDAFPRMVS